MSPATFDYILDAVFPLIEKNTQNNRKPISPVKGYVWYWSILCSCWRNLIAHLTHWHLITHWTRLPPSTRFRETILDTDSLFRLCSVFLSLLLAVSVCTPVQFHVNQFSLSCILALNLLVCGHPNTSDVISCFACSWYWSTFFTGVLKRATILTEIFLQIM